MSATAPTGTAPSAIGERRFVLRLYVAGATPVSQRAIVNLRDICATHLDGRHELEVIDVYQQPERAAAEQIVAVPTLIRLLPEPTVRVVGDLSDHTRVLAGLHA